jgi:aminoglycoside phosphotransferase (APT) family kinase protein
MDQKILLERIEPLHQANSIEKLSKGYSQEKKYIVDYDDETLLLRVGDADAFDRKNTIHQLLDNMQQLRVLAPKPIETGVVKESNISYSLYTYIKGEDAKEAMHILTEEEQYHLGTQAGEQLANMHTIKAPSKVTPWYDRALAKHTRYLEAYKTCGVKINQDDKIIAFIEKHKHLLKNRPNCFQHDDFHLGNIIVKDKQYAGVIDFDNFDWGDPFHDFVKVALFQREDSVPFSIGQIDGYFKHQVPQEFWLYYSIYSAMVIFSSVVWCLRYAPDDIDAMLERLNVIVDDYECFEELKPKWYIQRKTVQLI